MKLKITLSLLSLFGFFSVSFGQSFNISNPNQTFEFDIFSPNQLPTWIGLGSDVYLTSGNAVDLKWEQLIGDIPSDWTTNSCLFYFNGSGNDCSATNGSTMLFQMDYIDVGIELASLDTSGVAHFQYLVYDENDSLNSHQIVNFTFEVNFPDFGDDPFSITQDTLEMTFDVNDPWSLPVYTYHNGTLFNHTFDYLTLNWALVSADIPSDWVTQECYFTGYDCTSQSGTLDVFPSQMNYFDFNLEVTALQDTGTATHTYVFYDPSDSIGTAKTVTFITTINVNGDFDLGFQIPEDFSYQFIEIFDPNEPVFAHHFSYIENPFPVDLEIGWKILSETYPAEWGNIQAEMYIPYEYYTTPFPSQGSFQLGMFFNEQLELFINEIETNNTPGQHELQIHFWNMNDSLDNNKTVKFVTQICPAIVDADLITTPDLNSFCAGVEVTLDGAPGYDHYAWSNGSTDQSTTFFGEGLVTLRAWNEGDCIRYDEIDIQLVTPYDENICLVTVDDATGGNVVVWEKTPDQKTTWFNIYKETNSAGTYELVGSQLYDSLSIFVDENSNPLAGSSRYRISTLDSCGNESFQSFEHKTMHLTSSVGINNEVNLIWDNYEGFNYSTFNIYRGTSPDDMQLLTQRPSNTFTYTDLNPPAGELYYEIEVEFPDGCNPTRSAVNPFSSSSSNIVTTSIVSTVDPFANNGIKMFPNPATSKVQIEIPQELNIATLDILDYSGKLMKSISVDSNFEEIPVSELASGLYLVVLKGDKMYRDKLIVD